MNNDKLVVAGIDGSSLTDAVWVVPTNQCRC